MKSANKALLVVTVAVSLGMWGCGQGGGTPQTSARLRDLESRHTKLEEDYRATVAARDEARKKLHALEKQRNGLQQDLEQARKERDDARQQAAARTLERDGFQTHLHQLGKELQGLIGKIDAVASSPSLPPTTATSLSAPSE
jgi:chromosome segregation ATPase